MLAQRTPTGLQYRQGSERTYIAIELDGETVRQERKNYDGTVTVSDLGDGGVAQWLAEVTESVGNGKRVSAFLPKVRKVATGKLAGVELKLDQTIETWQGG